MQNFVFHNPTKIIFGRDTINQLGIQASTIGSQALLVYGQNSIKTTGLYERILKDLETHNISIIEHGGVKANPLLSHAREGVKKAIEHQCQFIIAVGGGSVLDEAKAIAASVGSQKDIWDFFTLKAPITKVLPIITVLTIPATGSEMNAGMVITNDETHDKLGMGHPLLYPVISILDPILTFSIPRQYTAYAAVDIVSHLTESYFNNNAGWTILQQYYVEGMVKTVIAATQRVLENPKDYEARATFMWAATLGWNGLNTAGLGNFQMMCHIIEHPISAVYNISHGAGLAIVTPSWMDIVIEEKSSKLARFAQEVFGINKENELATAKAGIAALRNWYKEIGAPQTFAEAKIETPDIERLTSLTLKAAELRGLKELNHKFVTQVYQGCL